METRKAAWCGRTLQIGGRDKRASNSLGVAIVRVFISQLRQTAFKTFFFWEIDVKAFLVGFVVTLFMV